MSSNAELLRTALEAWNRRDLEAVARHLHPDFEWVEHDQNPEQGPPHTGPDAIARVTEDLEEGLDDYRAEVVDIVEVRPERFVAVLRETGRGVTSGAAFSTEFGYVVTMLDGKAVRIEAHRDPRDAFAAAGHTAGSGA